MKKIIVAYAPVLHRGYLEFFWKHDDAEVLYLIGELLIEEFPHLRKDVRAVAPVTMRPALQALLPQQRVEVAVHATLSDLCGSPTTIVMPDEEECRSIAAKYLAGCKIEFDRSVFLRWDRATVLAEETVRAERVVPFEGLVAEMMQHAVAEAEKATNLWRRVGAVIARDGEVLLVAHNTQVPSPRTPYYEGDPRMFFRQGLHYELTTDEHAEALLVGEAARNGLSLGGADLFVTTFPCPPCAKLVARTGFHRLYFAGGYTKLDGERILRERGIEIIQVKMKNPDA